MKKIYSEKEFYEDEDVKGFMELLDEADSTEQLLFIIDYLCTAFETMREEVKKDKLQNKEEILKFIDQIGKKLLLLFPIEKLKGYKND